MVSYFINKGLVKCTQFRQKLIFALKLFDPLLVASDKAMVAITAKLGEIAAIPLFIFALPLQRLDYLNPTVPFSLYVQVVKPSSSNN